MIVEKEKELFEIWKQGKKNFVMDGVVDEHTFLEQKCHFVFILKETDQMGNTALPTFLGDGAPGNGGHTWNPVCRWLTGEDRVFSLQERADILKKIAVVNLKKEDGGPNTDMAILENVVREDKDYIKKQLSFYYTGITPVVFVCCGPYILSMLNDNILGKVDLHINKPLPYAKPDDREIYYVAFNHPNAKKAGLTKKFKLIASLIGMTW